MSCLSGRYSVIFLHPFNNLGVAFMVSLSFEKLAPLQNHLSIYRIHDLDILTNWGPGAAP